MIQFGGDLLRERSSNARVLLLLIQTVFLRSVNMKRKAPSLVSVLAVLLILAVQSLGQDSLGKVAKQDSLGRVAKQHSPYTISVALEFTKKNRNAMLRVLSAVSAVDPNAYATGF